MHRRMKRVTDPLDEKVKARIVGRDGFDPGYVSSDSEHSSTVGDDVFSPTINDFLFGFNGDDEDAALPGDGNESETEPLPSVQNSSDVAVGSIEVILRDQRDSFRKTLSAHVMKAVEVFSCVKTSKNVTQRNVMVFLRGFGYDVAICNTKWESSGGLTGGNYEFIDVVRADNCARYFISLDFASEFEIARPTDSFQRLLQCLPAVFVGKAEELRQVLKVMSAAAKRSLKSRGLCLPPWRKHRFMQNKWLGPSRRTNNPFPVTFSKASQMNPSCAVKCRAVGFDAAVNGGGFWLPTAAETRTR